MRNNNLIEEITKNILHPIFIKQNELRINMNHDIPSHISKDFKIDEKNIEKFYYHKVYELNNTTYYNTVLKMIYKEIPLLVKIYCEYDKKINKTDGNIFVTADINVFTEQLTSLLDNELVFSIISDNRKRKNREDNNGERKVKRERSQIEYRHNYYELYFQKFVKYLIQRKISSDYFNHKLEKRISLKEQNDDYLNNVVINLRDVDFVYYADAEIHYYEDTFSLIARQKCNDGNNIYISIYFTGLNKIDVGDNDNVNLYEGKVFLSRNKQIFLSELDAHECRIEQLYTFFEKEKNETFHNRKKYFCDVCKNNFDHESPMMEDYDFEKNFMKHEIDVSKLLQHYQ